MGSVRIIATLIASSIAVAFGQDIPTQTSSASQSSASSQCNGCIAYVPIVLAAEFAVPSTLSSPGSFAPVFSEPLGTFSFDLASGILGDDLAFLTIAPTVDATISGTPLTPTVAALLVTSYIIGTKIASGSSCYTTLVTSGYAGLWPTSVPGLELKGPYSVPQIFAAEDLIGSARSLETRLVNSAQLSNACKAITQTTLNTFASFEPTIAIPTVSDGTSPGASQTSATTSGQATGLSTGAIAGLVVAVILIVLGLILFSYAFYLWRRKPDSEVLGLSQSRERGAAELPENTGREKDVGQQGTKTQFAVSLPGMSISHEKSSSNFTGSKGQASKGIHEQVEETPESKAKAMSDPPENASSAELQSKNAINSVVLSSENEPFALGLNLIHNPSMTAECDIVFVHGFFGDTISTWSSKTGRFWPRDLLSRDIPMARIWLYSYTTKALSGKSYKTTQDCGQEMIAQLLLLRSRIEGFASDTPLVMVSHGTGGFVVAQALVEASSPKSSLHHTFLGLQIRGIVFLSTPFNRIPFLSNSWWSYSLSNWISFWMSDSASRMLLEFAKTDKRALTSLKSKFGVVAPGKVFSFYDTEGLRFSRPLCDKSACALGLPQENTLPSRKFSLDVSFETGISPDYNELMLAIVDCAYGPVRVENRENIATFSIEPAIILPRYPKSDIKTATPLKSRSLPDVSTFTENLSSSINTTSKHYDPTSTSLKMPASLEASKVFLRAAADAPAGLPIQFQLGAGAIAGAGVVAGTIIGGVNAHTARIAAKANVKSAEASARSADAATLSSQIAEKKLLFDMRKELDGENVAKTDDEEPETPSQATPGSSKPGPINPLRLSTNNTKTTVSANAAYERAKQEEKNVRKIREEIERQTANRKSSARDNAQLRQGPTKSVMSEDTQLPGRLQQIRSVLFWGQSKAQTTTSRKGKEKAKDEDVPVIEPLELDPLAPLDIGIMSVPDQYRKDNQTHQPLDAVNGSDITDHPSNPVGAINGAKLQHGTGASQVNTQPDIPLVGASAADTVDPDPDPQQQSGLGDMPSRKSNGLTIGPINTTSDPASEVHQSSVGLIGDEAEVVDKASAKVTDTVTDVRADLHDAESNGVAKFSTATSEPKSKSHGASDSQ